MAFTSDNARLATIGGSTLRYWDAATGERVGSEIVGPEHAIGALAFSPSGDRLLAVDGSGAAHLWESATGRPIRELIPPGNSRGMPSVAISPDGRLAAVANWDSKARLIELETGRELGRFGPTRMIPPGSGGLHGVFNVAFSPDGRTFATAYFADIGPADRPYAPPRNGIELWDIASGRSLRLLRAPNYSARELAFTPGGASIVAAGDEAQVRIYDVATGVLRFRFSGDNSIAATFSLTPDGRHYLIRGEHRIVRTRLPGGGTRSEAAGGESVVFWDVATGRRVSEIDLGGGYLWKAYLRPGGKTLVAVSIYERNIRVVDLESGAELLRHEIPPHLVPRAFALSPGGAWLATGHADSTVLIWDLTAPK